MARAKGHISPRGRSVAGRTGALPHSPDLCFWRASVRGSIVTSEKRVRCSTPERGRVAPMTPSSFARGGAAIFLGSAQFGVLIIVAEALYQNYDVSKNAISDLGATCTTTTCTVFHPSSEIFNGSLLVLGAALLLGAYLIRGGAWKPFVACVALAGFGVVGVGLLPETAGGIHGVVSLIAFLFSGLAAILSFRVMSSPFRYFSVVLGAMALMAIVLFLSGTYLGLGLGGMERMIAYPSLFWYVSLGGYLMSAGA